jgi:chorismate synthase
MLRFLTAGESHGKGLVVILEGMPAGLHLDLDAISEQLRRRQGGYGRGRRMAIESDQAEVLSGVRAAETLGSPIALLIRNRDWENWKQTMHAEDQPPADATGPARPLVTRPRPGHADLAGVIKYDRTDIRDVLERASARETAARVAAGAIARQLLAHFDVQIVSHVYTVNGIGMDTPLHVTFEDARGIGPESALRCADPAAEARMIAEIDRCREAGDTAGGAFEVIVRGLPVNNAGGLEGGVTNGEDLRISGFMKPIATLMKPLRSVDLTEMIESPATIERSDVCAISAAAVVGEAVVTLTIADSFLEKFSGDSLGEIERNYKAGTEHLQSRFHARHS